MFTFRSKRQYKVWIEQDKFSHFIWGFWIICARNNGIRFSMNQRGANYSYVILISALIISIMATSFRTSIRLRFNRRRIIFRHSSNSSSNKNSLARPYDHRRRRLPPPNPRRKPRGRSRRSRQFPLRSSKLNRRYYAVFVIFLLNASIKWNTN